MMSGHRASFLVSCAAPDGGPPSLMRTARARQRSFAALAQNVPPRIDRWAAGR